MSSEPLPDDVNRWPDDPFQLLGVPRNADQAAIRRAYAQLIRRFKPEHHPEAFRRIRAAFEFLSQIASAPGELASRAHLSVPRAVELERRYESHAARSSLTGSDDLSSLYARLRGEGGGPASVDSFLRLYWLLRLDSDLDPERRPIDWPLAALATGETDSRFMALYRSELDRTPEACEHGDGDRLYDAMRGSPLCAEFAIIRLQAAIRARRWSFAQRELDRARNAMRFNQADWVRLLLSLTDRLAWLDEPLARAMLLECTAEIDGAVDLQLTLSEQIDARDQLLILRDSWRMAFVRIVPRSIGRALLELVPDTWDVPHRIWRRKMLSAIEPWNAAPLLALKDLDYLRNEHQPLLNYFHFILGRADAQRTSTEYPARRYSDLLDGVDESNYQNSREMLLRACLRDGIDIDLIARRILDDQQFAHLATSPFIALLVHDLPLRCVLRGCRLFQ